MLKRVYLREKQEVKEWSKMKTRNLAYEEGKYEHTKQQRNTK